MAEPQSPHVEVLGELQKQEAEVEEIVGMELSGARLVVYTSLGRLLVCDTSADTPARSVVWRELPPLPPVVAR